MQYSDEQLAIINSPHRFLVVDAPAGSGKTEVLAARLLRQLSDMPGSGAGVLAVSYTTQAAREVKDRIRLALGAEADRVRTGTIHAYCHDLLIFQGTHVDLPVDFEVLSDNVDRVACLTDYCASNGYPEPVDPLDFLANVDLGRMTCDKSLEIDQWRDALEQRGAVDFTGMIEKTLQLLSSSWQRKQQRNLYPIIIVDEAQNLAPLQYKLLTLLAGSRDEPGCSLALFGDERQGIVGFAGARHELMQTFIQDYSATQFHLTLNYRSASAIQEVLHKASVGLTVDHRKVNSAAPGEVVSCTADDELDEARKVVLRVQAYLKEGLTTEVLAEGESGTLTPEDIGILGRSAASLAASKKALEEAGIEVAYGAHARDWLESLEGQCLRAIVSWTANPKHQSNRRLIQELSAKAEASSSLEAQSLLAIARGDGPSLSELDELAQRLTESAHSTVAKDGATVLEALNQYRLETRSLERNVASLDVWLTKHASSRDLPPGVRVLTVHKAQGNEFKAVHIVGMADNVFPNYYAKTAKEMLDEQRIFYVACSRATRRLGMSWPKERRTQHGTWKCEPSPFLSFVQQAQKSGESIHVRHG